MFHDVAVRHSQVQSITCIQAKDLENGGLTFFQEVTHQIPEARFNVTIEGKVPMTRIEDLTILEHVCRALVNCSWATQRKRPRNYRDFWDYRESQREIPMVSCSR